MKISTRLDSSTTRINRQRKRRPLAALILAWLLSTAALAGAQTFIGYLDVHGSATQVIPITLTNDGSLSLQISVGPALNLNANAAVGVSEGVIVYDTTGTNRLYGAVQGEGTTATHIVNGLAAGNYSVRLTAIGYFEGLGWGSYTLIAAQTPDPLPNDPEPNDDFDDALTAVLDTPVTGHLGYLGNASVMEKQDYWKVTIPADGTLHLDIAAGAVLNLNQNASLGNSGGIMVYDADRSTVFYSAVQGQNTTATHSAPKLKAGTYYVRLVVLGPGYYGSYQMTARHTPETVANDAEPNDQFTQPGLLSLDTPVTGHLGYYGAGAGTTTDLQDWWRIILPHAGNLELEVGTSPLLNLNLNASAGASGGIVVYDSDATTVLFEAVQGNNTTNTHIATRLKPGVYYVRLTKIEYPSYYGGYRLTPHLVAAPEDSELNDIAASASPASLDTTVWGILGYLGGGAGLTQDQVDWWKFTMPATGQLQLVITTFGNLNLNANATVGVSEGITLFNTAVAGGVGDRLFGNSQGGNGNPQSYPLNLAAGEYYLRLVKLGNDGYWGRYSAALNYVGVPIINSPATARGLTGQPFNYTITALGGGTFGAAGLPDGLLVNSGLISGTLGAPGTHDITLLATNAGGTASAPLTLTILPFPTLTIQSVGLNQVVLSWPTNYANFALRSATALSGNPAWDVVTPAPVTIGNWFSVTNLVELTARYYRLNREAPRNQSPINPCGPMAKPARR